MSIIWQKTSDKNRYQVRSAGNSLRLYKDGVFHTQYNESRPLCGNVWDLLFIPAFFLDPESIRRVLVLGVGGGAVIRLLNQFVDPDEVIGVELNPTHLHVARRFFGVGRRQARLICADAVRWINDYHGPRFDLIVDDLFGEELGQPKRAVVADRNWFTQLQSHLSPTGVLVMNFASLADLRECAYFRVRAIRNRFKSAFRLYKPQYENSVAAFLPGISTSGQLRRNLARMSSLNSTSMKGRIDYGIRKI